MISIRVRLSVLWRGHRKKGGVDDYKGEVAGVSGLKNYWRHIRMNVGQKNVGIYFHVVSGETCVETVDMEVQVFLRVEDTDTSGGLVKIHIED